MKNSIKEGDFVTLSKDKGYSEYQRRDAMQVMELYENTMTVKCGKNKCMTKSYDHFEKVNDISKFNIIHRFEKLTDNSESNIVHREYGDKKIKVLKLKYNE